MLEKASESRETSGTRQERKGKSLSRSRRKATAVVDEGPALSLSTTDLFRSTLCFFLSFERGKRALQKQQRRRWKKKKQKSWPSFAFRPPTHRTPHLAFVLSRLLASYTHLDLDPNKTFGKKNMEPNLSEAFAAWLPPFGVPLSYAVAIGYVVVDTVDKGLKAYSNAGKELEEGVTRLDVDIKRLQLLLSLERATDTIVWQLLASVFVPGFTIHTVVQAMHAALLPVEGAQPVRAAAAALAGSVGLASADALVAVADKAVPTALGLAAIPFIVHPIDNAIHALLNVTLRPALKKFVCEQGKGKEAGLELCQDCGPWTRPAKKKESKH